jgi:purine-nucleoside phosphorylase
MPFSLLLAAFPPELAGLDKAPPPGWRVATTGVGAVVAAAATARLVESVRPSRVLFVGTCGAYDARLAPLDLIAARSAIATSLEELDGRSFRPPLEAVRFDATWTVSGLPVHDVAVPPAITRSADGAAKLATVAPAEHLELTGVFAACRDAGVPVAAVLAVANHVGPAAHEEWEANHARASRALVDALHRLLIPA